MSFQIIIKKNELDVFREVLKQANRDYVLNYKEQVQEGMPDAVHFTIDCPNDNAAQAYWRLGMLDHQLRISKRKILPKELGPDG